MPKLAFTGELPDLCRAPEFEDPPFSWKRRSGAEKMRTFLVNGTLKWNSCGHFLFHGLVKRVIHVVASMKPEPSLNRRTHSGVERVVSRALPSLVPSSSFPRSDRQQESCSCGGGIARKALLSKRRCRTDPEPLEGESDCLLPPVSPNLGVCPASRGSQGRKGGPRPAVRRGKCVGV